MASGDECVPNVAKPDLSLLPVIVKSKIVSLLELEDRLNLALTSRSFHDAVFLSDSGCQLFILCTSQGLRVNVKALPNKRFLLDMDPPVSFWSWTLEKIPPLHCHAFSKSIAKLASRACFVVDDKFAGSAAQLTLIDLWLGAIDEPRLTALIVRPCSTAKETLPETVKEFISKLRDLIARNASSLRELHFVTWPLKSSCGVPAIHDIINGLPKLKEKLKRFSYLWQGADLRSWQPANVPYPTDDFNIPLICSMRNLRRLNVASQILTKGFLAAISSYDNGIQLECLRVCYSDVVHVVADEDWSLFFSRHFRCRLEFSLMRDKIRANTPTWNKLFLPSLPLTKITFMKHAPCEDKELSAISASYSKTLKSCATKSLNVSASSVALLDFVERCVNLNSLVYFGVIDFSILEKIVGARRRWNELIFVADQINLADPRADDQDEFFFERRKLLMEAEFKQISTLEELVKNFRSIDSGKLEFISLKQADWNVEHCID